MSKNLKKKNEDMINWIIGTSVLVFSIVIVSCCHIKHIPREQNINWLDDPVRHGWDTVAFHADPDDSLKIEQEKLRIRLYVRGWLAEYNSRHPKKRYVVQDFEFVQKSRSPLRYTVTAYLSPPAKAADAGDHHGVGGHLIPPEPPPPPQ